MAFVPWPRSATEVAVAPGTGAAVASPVLELGAIDRAELSEILARLGIELELLADAAPIPGSYWGEPEAGLIGNRVFARADTPVHSVLHEASHLIVAGPERRAAIHTDASDSTEEEDAACYLQIVLASRLADVGFERVLRDMDTWGYSFRLGSAAAWFAHDADDARIWLERRGMLPLPF
jgi:hypothetical protein